MIGEIPTWKCRALGLHIPDEDIVYSAWKHEDKVASGNGKSTLSGLLLLQAINQGYGCMAYSGELSAAKFQEWINLQAAGGQWISYKWDSVRGRNIPYVPTNIQQRIMNWYSDKLMLYDNSEVFVDMKQTDAIINVFTQAARKFNTKVYLIDNLMTSTADSDDEWRAQAVFVNAVKQFAVHYDAHVILVAHARKVKAGMSIQNADISGASAIGNLADNCIVIEKPDLRIVKNREYGILKTIQAVYCPDSHRVYEVDKGDLNNFNWDKTGLTPPSKRACDLPEYAPQLSQLDRQPF